MLTSRKRAALKCYLIKIKLHRTLRLGRQKEINKIKTQPRQLEKYDIRVPKLDFMILRTTLYVIQSKNIDRAKIWSLTLINRSIVYYEPIHDRQTLKVFVLPNFSF